MANPVIEKLFKNQKPALLLAIGSAVGLAAGGAIAWWSLQQPAIEELPTGADIVPQEAALTLSFSTQEGQWQQLRQFGTPATEAAFNQNWTQLRDRLLTANGLDYNRDIRPWVGSEVTVAFLAPATLGDLSNPQQVQPYAIDPLKGETPAVLVLPIANLSRAQALLAKPKVAAGQEWVDRDYKGIKIREVQGKTERAYAAALLGDRYLVVSTDSQAVEQVVDTFKGEASVARTPGYGQAFTQLKTESPLLRMYVNVPVASIVAANNATQPIPPQGLALLKGNQGFASTMVLEPEGVQFQALAWLPGDSKVRYRAANKAQRMPNLLPTSTLLMTSGDNFRQTWQNYSQQVGQDSATGGVINPNFLRQGFKNLTGLDFDKDLINWMDGEFAIALVSDPGGAKARAGLLLLAQAGNRKAADEAFQKLDGVLRDRYRFRVEAAQLGGKPAVTWTSPFSSLTMTRGWLDGNIAYLAIGEGVGSMIVPTPAQPLSANPLFNATRSTELKPDSGHFFIEMERLANRDVNLPLPVLPTDNLAYISALRAINVTAAVQDGRTTRYDVHVRLRKVSNPPAALPSPKVDATLEAPSPSP